MEMILVTGGSGLLGSHLLVELARQNREVIALKRPSSSLEEVKRVFGYYLDGKEEAGEDKADEVRADDLFGRIRWIDQSADYQVRADGDRVREAVEAAFGAGTVGADGALPALPPYPGGVELAPCT